jgi:hypothetical protein
VRRGRTKIGLAVVVVIGIILWLPFRESYGVGANSVPWLPREAHNVTYIKNFWFAEAEFDIERGALEKWCAKRKMPLQEIDDEGYHSVIRCWRFLESRGVVPAVTEPNETSERLARMARCVKVLRAGDLFYDGRWSNGGGYTIGYDTKEKRGYYSYSVVASI